jgi:glycosyltransferase involved in cell wall biosynthesis
MRICVVYDCLYPYTVGGAERWYRNLAERVAASGHEVTYLTLRQWSADDDPRIPDVRVVPVAAGSDLYANGRRRISPPLRFGQGVLRHLRRYGDDYDLVHTASFPYFSVLAARAAQRRRRFCLFVDWHEVWSHEYWDEYLGHFGGSVGWQVQRRCARVPHTAFCFSRLHERRLRELGFSGAAYLLEGEYAGTVAAEPAPAEPFVLFAGRHIPEKRVLALVQAMPLVREHVPDLRARIYGDGPERQDALALVSELDLMDVVEAPGFVTGEAVEEALRNALCLILPSRREGYGLVVVEAAARGTPSVVTAGADNAATELVSDGENGFVAATASPADLADSIARVAEGGDGLRRSTLAWFRRNERRLSFEASLETVLNAYDDRR